MERTGVPSNEQLLKMSQELEQRINDLTYEILCLKAEQEKLNRQRY